MVSLDKRQVLEVQSKADLESTTEKQIRQESDQGTREDSEKRHNHRHHERRLKVTSIFGKRRSCGVTSHFQGHLWRISVSQALLTREAPLRDVIADRLQRRHLLP